MKSVAKALWAVREYDNNAMTGDKSAHLTDSSFGEPVATKVARAASATPVGRSPGSL